MLEAFLLDCARTDHVWSESDCAMTIANWWRVKHGVDPAADLRGTYFDEAGCLVVVERNGGMQALVGERAHRVGALPTLEPGPGDIGVIRVHGLDFGAILGPTRRWHVKSPRGVAAYRCAFLAAWRT